MISGGANFWFLVFPLFFVFLLDTLVFHDVHSLTLHDLALGSLNDGVLHIENTSRRVHKNGRRRLQDAGNQRRLDQLKVKFLKGVVAEDCTIVRQVHFEVVPDAECLCEDALRHQCVHMVVVRGVLAEEARARGALTLTSNLELED